MLMGISICRSFYMKKSILIFALSFIFCVTCFSQEKNDDQIFVFSNCIYTTENYVSGGTGHSFVLGDESFSPKSDQLHKEAANSFCIFFSLSNAVLKPGVTNLTSENGSFEGAIINHGTEIAFKLDSPLECTFDGKNIHLKGIARLYEPGTSTKSGKTLSFVYNGLLSNGLFVDLWPNPAYKIKR